MKAPARVAVLCIGAIILTCALAGCAAEPVQARRPVIIKPRKPVVARQTAAGQEIAGKWRVVDSSARFTISFAGRDIIIEGVDSSDGEKFIVSGVQWDGKKLSGAFKMPSTNYTTFSELELVDADTLKGTYKSAEGCGEEVWKRE